MLLKMPFEYDSIFMLFGGALVQGCMFFDQPLNREGIRLQEKRGSGIKPPQASLI